MYFGFPVFTYIIFFQHCVSAIPSRLGDADLMQDDSLDAPASVASGDPPTPCATPVPMQPTPASSKKVRINIHLLYF